MNMTTPTTYPVAFNFDRAMPTAWSKELAAAAHGIQHFTANFQGSVTREQLMILTGSNDPKPFLGVSIGYFEHENVFGLSHAHGHLHNLCDAWKAQTSEVWKPRAVQDLDLDASVALLVAVSEAMNIEWELDNDYVDEDFIIRHRDAWHTFMERDQDLNEPAAVGLFK